ncbi:MAG: shikimate dehydrogenase [Gemmatimonadota bacterium]|nr:shikimate dehydrogenase [Gemmatimonadota bacterium]
MNNKITSRTRVLGVIGDPIEHSLSPVLHNYVLERLGLDYCYLAFRVPRDKPGNVASSFRTLGLAGLNVTIPHKEAVAGQMDTLTEEARAVGAVNTIGMDKEGGLVGHNTDVAGFLGSLQVRGLDKKLSGRPAVVLGAGGAARAVLLGLARAEVKEVILVNRTESRAGELARWFGKAVSGQVPVRTVSPADTLSLEKAIGEAFITVNVTPLGMAPDTDSSPLPEGLLPEPETVVYDTIYNPMRTRLLEAAEKGGCTVVGGLDMLIIQGMESLSWWLGREIPWQDMLEDIRRRLLEALS